MSAARASPHRHRHPWLVTEAGLEWFCLEDDDYRPQLRDAQGVLHSRVFPGLRLPAAPLLAGDTAKVLAAVTQDEMPMGKQSENSVVKEDPFTTGK